MENRDFKRATINTNARYLETLRSFLPLRQTCKTIILLHWTVSGPGHHQQHDIHSRPAFKGGLHHVISAAHFSIQDAPTKCQPSVWCFVTEDQKNEFRFLEEKLKSSSWTPTLVALPNLLLLNLFSPNLL